MSRGTAGFTLIELLVAGAVFAVLLLVMAQLFSSSYRSYAVTEEVGERRQVTQAAMELLKYDLSLSGFRCADAIAGSRTFASTPFSFTRSPASLTVRYFEDRYVGGACTGPIVVEYSVANGALMRGVDGGTPETVVEGVSGIDVVWWLNRVNSQFVFDQELSEQALAGVVLRLSFFGGTDEVFTVGFRNSQCADLSACQ